MNVTGYICATSAIYACILYQVVVLMYKILSLLLEIPQKTRNGKNRSNSNGNMNSHAEVKKKKTKNI